MIESSFHFGPTIEAMALRSEVFLKEQGFSYDEDDIDPRSWSLLLKLDGLPIATGRLYEIDPETYMIGRLAVKKEFRGQQIGTYAVKFLLTKAKTLGARKVLVHSQLDKRGFYEKLGFKPNPEGEVDFEDGVAHILLYKVIAKSKRPFRTFY